MKKLWFKNKRYGWGWTPASWEGWLVTLIFVGMAACAGLVLGDDTVAFLIAITMLVALLILICQATGEKPEWRWGNKK